ncbi:MAG TPA: cupin domain-containing protein [Longimicrobiaceae bacterium]|jgi:quercetin dioxygenase-like cupin family protein|nr:cupin domain-containing protein [Longimicrobiaceae bacterium]
MPSINRPLAGPILTFDLDEQLAELRREEAYVRSGRAGRTLAKSGRFRLTMVAVADGVEIGTHQADSPMTLQVLAGQLHFRAADREYDLDAGQVLFFGPGDAHDIRARGDSALLLTLSALGDDYQMDQTTPAG